jgi:hypothetical protein
MVDSALSAMCIDRPKGDRHSDETGSLGAISGIMANDSLVFLIHKHHIQQCLNDIVMWAVAIIQNVAVLCGA